METGISVNDRLGSVDWGKAAKSGIAFAMLRCGVGGACQTADACLEENAAGCMEQHIPYGLYFTSGAVHIEEIRRETEFVLRILERYAPAYPVMLRWESDSRVLPLPPEEKGKMAQVYCDAIEAAGCEPGVCANKYWFTHLLTDVRFRHWNRWVIQQYKECTCSGPCLLWQYTSMGRVDGIQGNVERLKKLENTEAGKLPELKGYVGASLTGALNSCGYPSGFDDRGRLAVAVGLVASRRDYRGTAAQNRELLKRLGATVSCSNMLREGVYVKIKPDSRNINTGDFFEKEVYQNTFQVLAVSGVSVIFGIEGRAVGKVNRNSVWIV